MSTLPDNEFNLEKLFLPAWAQEDPSASKYAKYEGEVERSDRDRGDRRGPRRPRRDGPSGDRRGGDRPRGDRRAPRGPDGGERRGGEGRRGERPSFRGERDERRDRERREPPPPLPEVGVELVPEAKGVESLARQIKMTGRAYPLFDIAQMILQKPDRTLVEFHVKKNAEGKPVQPLFVCALDDTLWLSEDEAVDHVLKKHFATFYQAERTATEPPKGKYTFVAQCGLSGTILGPPNHHDYQNQLRKLHAERFSRMPFEVYRSRVRIVRDEEVVKKWVDDQSWKTEYLCLNLPEPVRLASMEAVNQHFRQTHKDNIIKAVEAHTLNGSAARSLRSPDLARLVRNIWEDQRRFPLQIATVLSQQFASHGLQFFKVNRTVTHVCVARPHYLDVALTPVSEGVRRIVEYIDTHPRCTRRQLIESLAPSPPPPPPAPIPIVPEGQAPPPPPPPPVAEATPEQNALIGDLHWLIHQGHVIEFANGILETAKKPLPKPPKPEPKTPPAATEATATGEVPAAPAAPEPDDANSAVATESPALVAAATEPAPAAVTEEPASNGAPAPAAVEPASETPPAPVASPS